MWESASSPPADADGCWDADGSLELVCRGILSWALTDEVARLDTLAVQR